jgi:hypothetical protein
MFARKTYVIINHWHHDAILTKLGMIIFWFLHKWTRRRQTIKQNTYFIGAHGANPGRVGQYLVAMNWSPSAHMDGSSSYSKDRNYRLSWTKSLPKCHRKLYICGAVIDNHPHLHVQALAIANWWVPTLKNEKWVKSLIKKVKITTYQLYAIGTLRNLPTPAPPPP